MMRKTILRSNLPTESRRTQRVKARPQINRRKNAEYRKRAGTYLRECIHLRVGLGQAEGVGGPLRHEQELDGALPVSGVLAVP